MFAATVDENKEYCRMLINRVNHWMTGEVWCDKSIEAATYEELVGRKLRLQLGGRTRHMLPDRADVVGSGRSVRQ